ncbi:MAG: IclR family transcriptional regulator [Burkholderiales bacterium]
MKPVSARSKPGAYAVATVARAFAILGAFSDGAPSLALREIIVRTRFHKATAFRFLSALTDLGFIHKDNETGHYSLGFQLIQLGELAKAQNIVVRTARPVMQRLRDDIGETVFLSMRAGDYRVYVEQAESRQDIRRVAQIGDRKPLYFGSTGRVFLSAFSEAELEGYFARTPMKKLSKATIADAPSIRLELESIRKRGGIADGGDESGTGGSSVSGAIHAPDGTIAAVMSVSMPAFRCTATLRRKATLLLRGALEDVSRQLRASGEGRNSASGATRAGRLYVSRP